MTHMRNPIVPSAGPVPPALAEPLGRARGFAADSVSANTRRAYLSDRRVFEAWCAGHGIARPFPASPAAVCAFLADASETSTAGTLHRRLAGLSFWHKGAGMPDPCESPAVRAVFKGIVHTRGSLLHPKAPILREHLERMVARCPRTPKGLRDKAVLLLGFAAALRREEITGLRVEDLKWTREGLLVTVRHGKTDQEGRGLVKAIPFVDGPLCAARAVHEWLAVARIVDGWVIRSFANGGGDPRKTRVNGGTVAAIVKRAVAGIGLDPDLYAGHSLRAGHVTEARRIGVPDSTTMATTGHRRVETLDVYDRRENAFERTSAGEVLGAAPRGRSRR